MKNQKARIGVLILLAAAALLAAVYYFARPQPVAGAKTVTVEVIHGDGQHQDGGAPYRRDVPGPRPAVQ